MFLPVYEFTVTDILFVRIEFARGMLANKEDWNKLVMAAKMVSDPNIQVRGRWEKWNIFHFCQTPLPPSIQVKLDHSKPTANHIMKGKSGMENGKDASNSLKVLHQKSDFFFEDILVDWCCSSYIYIYVGLLTFFTICRMSSNLSPTGADLVATLPAIHSNEHCDHICVKYIRYILSDILALFLDFFFLPSTRSIIEHCYFIW